MQNPILDNKDFPIFLQGPYLKTSLTMLPYYAQERIQVMVPYFIKSETLESLLNVPEHIPIQLYTRNREGYLPSIKKHAQPALDLLREKKNLEIYIDNRIHAKIMKIDNSFGLVHSMNGTPTSETVNLEAGIITRKPKILSDIDDYFKFANIDATRIQ